MDLTVPRRSSPRRWPRRGVAISGAALAALVLWNPGPAGASPPDDRDPGLEPTRPAAVRAQAFELPSAERVGSWEAGIRGTLALFSEDTLSDTVGAALFGHYWLHPDVFVEAEIGWLKPSTESLPGLLPEGELRIIPLRGSLLFRVWRFGDAVPYAGGGGGVYLNSFSLDSSASRLSELGFDVSQDVDPTFGVHAAGGVGWRRGDWTIGIDAKWVLATADTTATVVDRVSGVTVSRTGELELDGLWLSAGVKYRF